MKKIILKISIDEYDSVNELNNDDRQLLEQAQKATDTAYAPYSQYRVGAAVLLENNVTITGNNQENAAYPSGLCAERVAIFYASSQYPDVPIKSIAITARANNFRINSPITPCGSCRQVMAELENRHKNKIKVILMGETGKIQIIYGIENILPLTFDGNNLKK